MAREDLAKRIQRLSIGFLGVVAVFAYGMAVGHYRVWPYALIQQARQAAASLLEFGELVPEGRRVRAPPGAARVPFTVHAAHAMQDGYYVFLGMNDKSRQYTASLYDRHGALLHEWTIDYALLDPDGPTSGVTNPHAFAVLPDGSVMVGFDDGDVMARIDACGRPLWVRPGIYHHAFARADDGSYWVWRAEGSHYAQHHYLVNFDPATGEPTRPEIGLVEDVIRHMGAAASIFGARSDYPFVHVAGDPENRDAVDWFHPNDVEALSESVAPMFPDFAAGDLLLSFRELDLVTVLDAKTHEVKWWRRGPWLLQHDADFTADGYISVYDNNAYRGRSEIIKMEPRSGRIVNELLDGELRFYSATMGVHQYLPNGNVFIVVPDEGRALEVTARGDYVMEYNNVSSRAAAYNEHVENGVWLPPDYFATLPRCGG